MPCEIAGEAVLPFTRAGGELIVPYAVELGITVSERSRGERKLHGVRIRGYMSQLGPIPIPFVSWDDVPQNPFYAPNAGIVPDPCYLCATIPVMPKKKGSFILFSLLCWSSDFSRGWRSPYQVI